MREWVQVCRREDHGKCGAEDKTDWCRRRTVTTAMVDISVFHLSILSDFRENLWFRGRDRVRTSFSDKMCWTRNMYWQNHIDHTSIHLSKSTRLWVQFFFFLLTGGTNYAQINVAYDYPQFCVGTHDQSILIIIQLYPHCHVWQGYPLFSTHCRTNSTTCVVTVLIGSIISYENLLASATVCWISLCSLSQSFSIALCVHMTSVITWKLSAFQYRLDLTLLE